MKIRGNTVGTTMSVEKIAEKLGGGTGGGDPWEIIDKICPPINESGAMVACEPVEGYPLSITAEAGATTINRCGKNLIDYTQAIPRNTSNVINIIDNGVEWASGNYYFFIPCTVKAGETVVFNCTDTAGAIGKVVLYNRGVKAECSEQNYCGAPMTATADADTIMVYKKNPQTAIETPIVMTNLQLEHGSTATAYEPHKAVETFLPGEDIPAWSGVNTLWADSGEITVTGRANPVAIIEKLTQAILSLGGNI